MRRIVLILFLASLLVIGVAACGTSDPVETEEITIGQSQELIFESLGSQSSVSQLKVVFTTTIPGAPGQNAILYSQVFIDNHLVPGITVVPEVESDILPGIWFVANGFTQQITIKYRPDLWRIVP